MASIKTDFTHRIQRPVKYKFDKCPECGHGFTIDPGSSTFTADHGDPVQCPLCGYWGAVVDKEAEG